MRFTKGQLQVLAHEGVSQGESDLKVVLTEHQGSNRWTQSYRMVFTDGTKFFESHYRVGSTEMQDESPYEYSDAEIECGEVIPVLKTITTYEKPNAF